MGSPRAGSPGWWAATGPKGKRRSYRGPGGRRPARRRPYAGTHVLLLIQDLDIRILNAATGELLRELVLDPTRDYQPTGRPPGPARNNPAPDEGSGLFRSPERSHGSRDRTRTYNLPVNSRTLCRLSYAGPRWHLVTGLVAWPPR